MTIEDVVKKIDLITPQIEKLQGEMTQAAKGDPENLSLGLMRLARLNSALGKHAATAQWVARDGDRAARRFRADKTLEYAKTVAVNKAEKQAELDSEELFSACSRAQWVADQANDLTYRTDTFLKMAQSRLSLIKTDIRNG